MAGSGAGSGVGELEPEQLVQQAFLVGGGQFEEPGDVSEAVAEGAAVVLDAPGRAGDGLGGVELCVRCGPASFFLV